MSKKTKKEKILAEYRRKIQSLKSSQFTVRSAQPVTKIPKTEYRLPEPEIAVSSVNPVYSEPRTDYSYVLNDLRRIVLLTALAICAQLVLWLLLGNRMIGR